MSNINEVTTDSHIRALRLTGGYATLDNLALLQIQGKDAAQFLQARVTSDVKALKSGLGQTSALLDRRAHLLACFTLYRLEDDYFIVCEKQQTKTILEQLESYLFSEQVTFKDASSEFDAWAVQGAYSKALMQATFSGSVHDLNDGDLQIGRDRLFNSIVIWSHQTISITAENGFLLFVPKTNAAKIIDHLVQFAEQFKMVHLSKDDLNTARIEAGIPIYGMDIDSDNLLPETGLDATCVSYTKGCYLGQEVIARVKAQGAPRRGLMGLIFESPVDKTFEINTEFSIESKAAGQLKSNVFSPTLGQHIALTLINREFRIPDQHLSMAIDGHDYKVKVVSLPFYQAPSNNERAQAIYQKALSLYTSGEELEAVELLRQALILDSTHADTYEMLGVMLGKTGQLDEAIALMQQLAEIDPESVMAHANLSVFYVQQGNKELAEEEKALAMNLRMQQATRELSNQEQAEKAKQAKIDEAKQRLEMFKQVLQIDQEDLLANFGLGNLYVELEQYEEAIPLLKKAVAVKPDYTAAYLALGRALEETKQFKDSIDAYNEGIAVASRRGDFEPMNRMKERLTALMARSEGK